MTFTKTDFIGSAQAVGVGGSATFTVCPDWMASHLLDSSKRLARFLEHEFPDIGHRKMLEKVAKAAGFSNWHAFQTLATDVITEYSPPQSGSRKSAPSSLFEAFLPALPLLTQVDAELAPDTSQLNGLEILVSRLSIELGDTQKIRRVIANLNGADNWAEMIERKPENASMPLYSFEVDHEGNGRFIWSAACAQLTDELDDYWQGYENRSKAEQHKAQEHVSELLGKRPDFLEGWLAYATMEVGSGNEEDAGDLFEEGIRRARALIPSGFKGEISWYVIENRFYHRLLYNQMRWSMRHGALKQATRLARLLLRYNRSDNLGVRLVLPLLLALDGNHNAAIKAIDKLYKDNPFPHSNVMLNVSLSWLLLGDSNKAMTSLLCALFEFPALRPILLNQKIPDLKDKHWTRGYIPDVETLWENYETVNIWRRDLCVDEWVSTVLENEDVVKAETNVRKLYSETVAALRNGNVSTIAPWYEGAMKYAANLVAKHGVR